jgi:glycosyltransferase involved in cell wall biosynthesis
MAGFRVVLVGPLPPPSGGMANQTRQLAGLLEREGLDVRVVQTNPPYRPEWIGRVRGVRAVFRLVPYLWALWRAAARADLFHVMANSGWSWHLFAAPAVWMASLRGVPTVVNYRGGEADSFLARSVRWVRPTLEQAAVVAVPSGFLKDVFGKYGVPTVVVPNVVDLELFSGGRAAERTVEGGKVMAAAEGSSGTSVGTTPDSPHLVVARNLEPIYDIPTAIEAFARIRERFPSARLTIAGSGPERERLEVLAAKVGVAGATRFTGRLDHAEMAQLYRSADILLNPSRVDNTPNSVLEALACGVPVVSTNVGGVPYIVRDGVTALLVEAGDPAAMAAAIEKLVTSPSLQASLRTEGRNEVQRYTWPRVRVALLGLYRATGRLDAGYPELS